MVTYYIMFQLCSIWLWYISIFDLDNSRNYHRQIRCLALWFGLEHLKGLSIYIRVYHKIQMTSCGWPELWAKSGGRNKWPLWTTALFHIRSTNDLSEPVMFKSDSLEQHPHIEKQHGPGVDWEGTLSGSQASPNFGCKYSKTTRSLKWCQWPWSIYVYTYWTKQGSWTFGWRLSTQFL